MQENIYETLKPLALDSYSVGDRCQDRSSPNFSRKKSSPFLPVSESASAVSAVYRKMWVKTKHKYRLNFVSV